ncbi:MAG: TlpA family protein disulfide reductase [Planctomycetota bacterium]|jgi:thiol-disulfide isomerase/thioredoxin
MRAIISIMIITLTLSTFASTASAQQSQDDELLQKIELQEQQIKELKDEIAKFRSEIGRLTTLCQKVGIDPNSDPDNIQRLPDKMVKLPRPERIIVGQLFPELKFEDLDGKTIDINNYLGKVVLIDFWATWCGPCIYEMPSVIALYNKYHDKGFEIIGISLDKDLVKFENYLSQNRITWPQYYDGKGWDNKISSRFGVMGIPATVLIDKNGIVRFTNLHGQYLENAVYTLCQVNR